MALVSGALLAQADYKNNIGAVMLDILFWVAVGAFVGWNFPQPFWAKIVQEKIQTMLAKK
jgi:hypothetical protein